jgi:hypothetical protein
MRPRPSFYLLTLLALLVVAGLPARSQATRLAATGNEQRTYLPLVQVPQALDLAIDGVEITQAVQTPGNTVPLVAGRPALVRVYAHTSGGQPLAGVTVTLTGTRNGQPLPPISIGPRIAPETSSRGDYASSFNALLPAEWLAGNVALVAAIDAGASYFDANTGNNVVTSELVFNAVPPLDIVIVPVEYTDQSQGRVFDAPTEDSVSEWLQLGYPLSTINVSFHAPIALSGDLEDVSDWYSFLNTIAGIKASEGKPSATIYYGLVSSGSSIADTWVPFAGGFVLGIGRIDYGASLGLDMSGALASYAGLPQYMTSETAAHEIGHNLGRYHAPCGTTDGLDSHFPYAGASIGQYGVDVATSTVLAPSATKDVMSYCDPQWISDYTYTALFQALRASQPRQAATSQTSLLVRATLGPSGPAIAPTYTVTARPDMAPATSDYRVELLDAAGKIVVSRPVAIQESETPHRYVMRDGRAVRQDSALARRGMAPAAPLAIAATVPLPSVPVAEVRLLHGGTILARRTLRTATVVPLSSDPSSARVVRQASAAELRWSRTDLPALVRYTADGGQSWVTLGMDMRGGALRLDPASLPSGAGRFEVVYADGAAPGAGAAMR